MKLRLLTSKPFCYMLT